MSEQIPARPQQIFESAMGSTIDLVLMVWKTTLAAHGHSNANIRGHLFEKLTDLEADILEVGNDAFEMKKELAGVFHQLCPGSHTSQWFGVYCELEQGLRDFHMAIQHIFLLQDVLVQLEKQGRTNAELSEALGQSNQKLAQLNQILRDLNFDTDGPTNTAIITAMALERGISFAEAERIHRKRWE